ncbi:MAG TPA: DUF1003 domain-containing protein [Candidatus Rothia avicola]|uniref:DUF1003 domain-containing protein n=1 Tax=Candidatus Rothia avicola TaxID=2840478 RepID=A0A9D1ZV11_9MICC|nr:DUF1003 domain-containing protein [Candidatus Rothia avicola]
MSDARERNDSAQTLGTPQQKKRRPLFQLSPNPDAFGQMTEKIARFMGTPQFLLWMTIFCALWLGWNTLAPEELQFDPRSLNFTLLTLMLSLQASYAAPLLLLAQNRQDDRDRVVARQDRQRDQRNLEETEYLTREIASLRITLREVATRDFVRGEMRDIMDELAEVQRRQEELFARAEALAAKANEPGAPEATKPFDPAAAQPVTSAFDELSDDHPKMRKKKKVKDIDRSFE